MATEKFYSEIAPFYDLIYPDWEGSISRQAEQLQALIQEHVNQAHDILDVSCGIGTQVLGLARLGFNVTASDLSPGEIERAKEEAERRGLRINFSVCDMRQVAEHHNREFDIILSADNSLPHLLSDEEILLALRQFYACTRPGGLCIITLRDYANEQLESNVIKPYAVQERDDGRCIIFQVWQVQGELYETSMYFIKDPKSGSCETLVTRAMYYAIPVGRVMKLMERAGFDSVSRRDDAFFQPVVMGKK